jgi:hypothetical protein
MASGTISCLKCGCLAGSSLYRAGAHLGTGFHNSGRKGGAPEQRAGDLVVRWRPGRGVGVWRASYNSQTVVSGEYPLDKGSYDIGASRSGLSAKNGGPVQVPRAARLVVFALGWRFQPGCPLQGSGHSGPDGECRVWHCAGSERSQTRNVETVPACGGPGCAWWARARGWVHAGTHGPAFHLRAGHEPRVDRRHGSRKCLLPSGDRLRPAQASVSRGGQIPLGAVRARRASASGGPAGGDGSAVSGSEAVG